MSLRGVLFKSMNIEEIQKQIVNRYKHEQIREQAQQGVEKILSLLMYSFPVKLSLSKKTGSCIAHLADHFKTTSKSLMLV